MKVGEIDTYLEHYGKKGQKWGVRNPNLYTKTGRKQQLINDTIKNNTNKRRVAVGAAFIASHIAARALDRKFNIREIGVYSLVAAGTLTTNSIMKAHGSRTLAELQS
jgi:hypothetical protein